MLHVADRRLEEIHEHLPIGKGGAHVAVQNMNLMFGLEETMGLKRQGLHPY